MKGNTNAQMGMPTFNEYSSSVTLSAGIVNNTGLAYTAPADGVYIIDSKMEANTSTSTNFVMGLGIDGVSSGYWSQDVNGLGWLRGSTCRIYNLTKNQTVTLYIYSSQTVSGVSVRIAVARLKW